MMNTDQIMLSPAKRARRCVLNLLACLVVAVGVYAGLHFDRWLFEKDIVAGASTDATTEKGSVPISRKDSQPSAPVHLSSMAGSLASAYLVAAPAKQ